MFGDGEAEPSKDHAVLLCWEACKVGLPLVLAHKLTLLDFETRKDAAQVNVIDTSPTSTMHTFLPSKCRRIALNSLKRLLLPASDLDSGSCPQAVVGA